MTKTLQKNHEIFHLDLLDIFANKNLWCYYTTETWNNCVLLV